MHVYETHFLSLSGVFVLSDSSEVFPPLALSQFGPSVQQRLSHFTVNWISWTLISLCCNWVCWWDVSPSSPPRLIRFTALYFRPTVHTRQGYNMNEITHKQVAETGHRFVALNQRCMTAERFYFEGLVWKVKMSRSLTRLCLQWGEACVCWRSCCVVVGWSVETVDCWFAWVTWVLDTHVLQGTNPLMTIWHFVLLHHQEKKTLSNCLFVIKCTEHIRAPQRISQCVFWLLF